MNRRHFLATTIGAAAAQGLSAQSTKEKAEKALSFDISLAQWSLHRTLRKKTLDNMKFPEFTKNEFGINAVEYVNSFFKDKAKDAGYLKELKKRCDDNGIKSVLIMCDGEGNLGATEEASRNKAVDNHKKWVEAAKFLGCTSIRVNSYGESKRPKDLASFVKDGLSKLSTFAKHYDINVIVENHGGLSSNGQWLAAVLKSVGMDNCGSLPDFGNFGSYDRYKGIKELMPYAKGVSAKSNVFDEAGNESRTDFEKAMKIVHAAGYSGYVGIEFAGNKISEVDGIKKTQALLKKLQTKYAQW